MTLSRGGAFDQGGGWSKPPEAGRPVRVLLADDDGDMRYLITTLLRADGYAVSECADGNQLMERIDAREEQAPGPPDVVVCDVCMPGPTGLEVLAEVRARHIRTPVILISAFGDEQIRYGGAELGAVAFLEKPFAIDELRAVLRALCPASP